MKALVIYDTYFGNTEKIAQAIGEALKNKGEAKVVNVTQTGAADFNGVDLLIIGSPTRAFSATKSINSFIKKLDKNKYSDLQIAVFDTRADITTVDSKFLEFMEKRAGYATDSMLKLLQKQGMQVADDTEGFFVDESEGPLKDGETDRAAAWAIELVK